MSKFNLARQPYYVGVIIYMAFVALVSLVNNTRGTGALSDVYLVTLAIACALAALSVYYLFAAEAGDNPDADVEVGGLGISKPVYYLGVGGIALWRMIAGYQLNHSTTGIASMWGILWLVASVVVLGYTYVNYRSLTAPRATAAPKPEFTSSPWKP